MTVQDDQDQQELVNELLKLQIRQTEILHLLVGPQEATAIPVEEEEGETTDRPLRIGDKVKVLNPTGIRVRRDTVCTVIKIGKRITSLAPNGHKIIRAAHNLERV
jgi:hypothetical protein